eukprot:768066-Hanusia_phi.AAC.11
MIAARWALAACDDSHGRSGVRPRLSQCLALQCSNNVTRLGIPIIVCLRSRLTINLKSRLRVAHCQGTAGAPPYGTLADPSGVQHRDLALSRSSSASISARPHCNTELTEI